MKDRQNTMNAALQQARRHVRQYWPGLLRPGHVLPLPMRRNLWVVAALMGQLQAIMRPCGDGGSPELSAGTAESGGACGGAGGCGGGGCGGEGAAQKRAVCSSILEHLYSGQATGDAAFDALVEVARECDLPRELLERWCDGLLKMQQTPRYATWSRLRADLDLAWGHAALCLYRALGDRRPLQLESPEADLPHQQLMAWASGLGLARALGRVGSDWKRGLLRIPLDDLTRFGLTEHDVGRFSASGTTGSDERWVAMMTMMRQRLARLQQAGQASLELLPSGAPRLCVAMVATSLGAQMATAEKRRFHDLDWRYRIGLLRQLGQTRDATRLSAVAP